MALLSLLLLLAALTLTIPCLVFAAQVVAAAVSRAPRPATEDDGQRPSVAVLVPAHNESGGLAATLQCLKAQLLPQDRLLVVADNCSDDTAAIARSLGAEVLERQHDTLRGKGYALDFGFQHLKSSPRDVLLIVDADCTLAPAAIDTLVRRTILRQRPTQALYLMRHRHAASVKQRFSEFAWRVKNHVRPKGFAALGLPCQLMGTGMGFPWQQIEQHSLASGHLVEDMQLGIALAAAGTPPLFVEDALVLSEFPVDEAAQAKQRTRWEHGHLSLILQALPALLLGFLRRPRSATLAMGLDLSVPPITLLTLLAVAMLVITMPMALLGYPTAFMVSLLSAVALGSALLTAWWCQGRDLLSAKDIGQALGYVLWKLPLYAKFLTARQVEWVRSKRGDKHD